MKVNILGTGHATATECYNTCFTICNKNKYFLIDSGGGNGILVQLKKSNIKLEEIDSVFISHIHIDHILGVIWIIRILAKKFYKNEINNSLKIYGHKEVINVIRNISNLLIPTDFLPIIDDKIKLIEISNCEKCEILGMNVEFFDINAQKVKQYGFSILENKVRLFTFIGDEVCNYNTEKYIENSKWLFADAYMAGEVAEKYNPIKRHHHSSVKFISEIAEKNHVENLILSHTFDEDIENRKKIFEKDSKKYFSGNVFVPDDLEIIYVD